MNYGNLLVKMLVFLVLLSIGYISSRRKITGPEFTRAASKLLLDVFIVAVIINSVAGERPEIQKNELLKVFLIITLTEVLIYAVSALITWIFFRRDRAAPQKEILLSVVNALFVGLPIIQAVCGNEGVFYLGVNTIPFFILLYSYGIFRLMGKSGSSGIAWKSMFKSVPLLASVAALFIFWFDIPLPGLVKEICSSLAPVTTPLSLVIIGASISDRNILSVFKNGQMWFLCFVRLILAPVIVFLIVSRLTANEALIFTCTIIAATPPGVMCTPLSIQYGYDAQFSSKMIMMSTMLSMATIPLLIYVLF